MFGDARLRHNVVTLEANTHFVVVILGVMGIQRPPVVQFHPALGALAWVVGFVFVVVNGDVFLVEDSHHEGLATQITFQTAEGFGLRSARRDILGLDFGDFGV